jgi:hypothetical protein
MTEVTVKYVGISRFNPNYVFEVTSEAFRSSDIDWDYCRGNISGEWWASDNPFGAAFYARNNDTSYRYEINKDAGISQEFAIIFRIGGKVLITAHAIVDPNRVVKTLID